MRFGGLIRAEQFDAVWRATRSERAQAKRIETCHRKRRYADWDSAEAAALLVWIENPAPNHANPCTPYPCDVDGERHYHYGHMRPRERRRT